MKFRKFNALVFVTVLALAMMLTACSGGSLTVDCSNEKVIVITADQATTDNVVLSGSFKVDDGDEIVMESALESGSVKTEFFPMEGDDSDEALPEDGEESDMVLDAAADDSSEVFWSLPAGDYRIRVTPDEKATGTVTITANPKPASEWTAADSTDDAADKAGIDLFLVDPSGLELGQVTNADYGYRDGVAQAHYGVAAVELFVRKGSTAVYGEDVSFDGAEYANEWTYDHDGTEVKCWGNREGEATKSIWTKGDYSYAILAYGAGGDTDFGLSQEDLESLLSNIQ